MELKELLINILDFFYYEDTKDLNYFLEKELEGITINQLNYLDVLFRLKKPTITDIAKNLNIAKPSVSELINKLNKLGYAKKEKDEKDSRTIRILLTKKGKKIYEKYREWEDLSYDKAIKIIQESLTDVELKILIELLSKVNKNIYK